ncbi:RNA recognition motif domain [Arabidopsis suecica]|uniref:RNA recognition motif domain n=1 Tax=Arabidopsis suecica TaxID=45249 RepID=A0A8T2CV64_ARASU|nr:RNA recognition motif domain [Arabidopsis suecica]
MLGGLYGDLPPPSDDEKPGGNSSSVWSSSTKMAPPTLRKPPAFAPPQAILRPQNKPKPIVSSQYKPPPPSSSTNSSQSVLTPANESAPSHQPALVGVTSSVIEEYDPARPNDYEEYKREKKRKAMEAEMKRELDKRRQEEEEREKREREERDKERERDNSDPSRLNISGEEAWKRRAAMSGGGTGGKGRSSSPPGNVDGFSIGKSETSGLGVGAGGQMTAAQRMMAKMGWKQGQGLGKSEQGITTPLMAKKTDRRAGVIVNASENKSSSAEKKVKSVNINGEPTRVLLLRNMVGPGEVDDELEDEVGGECGKYGTVTRVLIFEITEPNFPVHEAVRIFVQFSRPEETTKALVDLDGRYFGGRTVRATFYDEEKFSKNELAPVPGEIPGY